MKEAHIHMRSKHIYIPKGRISEARNRAAIMQHLSHFVAAPSHDFKPLSRNSTQLSFMLFYPSINRWIVFNRPIESQQLSFHRYSISKSMLRNLQHKICNSAFTFP
jgi:hypothetical protein